jgi:hypothetical protein
MPKKLRKTSDSSVNKEKAGGAGLRAGGAGVPARQPLRRPETAAPPINCMLFILSFLYSCVLLCAFASLRETLLFKSVDEKEMAYHGCNPWIVPVNYCFAAYLIADPGIC